MPPNEKVKLWESATYGNQSSQIRTHSTRSSSFWTGFRDAGVWRDKGYLRTLDIKRLHRFLEHVQTRKMFLWHWMGISTWGNESCFRFSSGCKMSLLEHSLRLPRRLDERFSSVAEHHGLCSCFQYHLNDIHNSPCTWSSIR